MAFENRYYVIIPAAEINNIDFSEVLETAPNTCRYSIDGTLTFVKYDGIMPSSVFNIAGRSDAYTHVEILSILSTSDWQEPIPE